MAEDYTLAPLTGVQPVSSLSSGEILRGTIVAVLPDVNYCVERKEDPVERPWMGEVVDDVDPFSNTVTVAWLKGKLRGKFTPRVDRAGNRETDVISVNSVFLSGVALTASGRLPSSIPLTIETDLAAQRGEFLQKIDGGDLQFM